MISLQSRTVGILVGLSLLMGFEAAANEAPKPEAGRIPLKLDVFGDEASGGRWPVTVGVPFARGALKNAGNVRLRSPNGAEMPVEVSVPATWDRDRRSIKWLHVKAMVDLRDAGKAFTLEYGPGVKRAAFKPRMKTSRTAASITVDTGRLRFVCKRRPFRFIDSAWLDRNGDGQYDDGEQVIVAGPASGLVVETMDGRNYRSDVPMDWPVVEKVELESTGPVEAVIRAEGWHKIASPGQKPERMMKYVVRIIATADTSLLRVFHSFILTEDEQTQYRQVTLGFSLPDEETSVAAETSGADALRETEVKPGAEAALLQLDHDVFRAQIQSWDGSPIRPTKKKARRRAVECLQNGRKCDGWLLVKRRGWGLTLATRDFWQNYAKGYEVRRDAVTLCPWPKDALRPLSFRPEDVIAPVFASSLSFGSEGGRGPGNYTNYTYAVGTSPLGVSKTHEYLLDFSTEPTLARSRQVQRRLNDPPLLMVPPAYACGTEVLGKIQPVQDGQYELEEAGFNAMLKRMEYGKPEHRHWGLVNFGESYQQTSDTGLIYVYRTYQNAGYGIVNDFPRGWFRSGNRDWFRYAVRRTRHNRDLDHCHYGPMTGGQTEYDALNWGTQWSIQSFWTHRLFLLLDWYMTGDRRSWDTFKLACEATLKLDPAVGPKDERHWFNQPKGLIHMYQATWDPRFLELARSLVDGILLAKERSGPDQWPPQSLAMNEYLQPSLIEYHRFTQDPRVLEYLKRHFTRLKGKQSYATGQAQDLAAYLYWQDGDVKWLQAVGGYEAMRDYMRLFETKVLPPVGGMRRYMVSEALQWMKNWGTKQRTVFHDKFLDKGFHHTWERLWYLMAAIDDARSKGLLKPYKGPNNPWSEPVWDEAYWKTATPAQRKAWGWDK